MTAGPSHRLRAACPPRGGFTLVELLIAVSLLAMLLTAMALATHASLTAYRENTDIAALSQTARVIVTRIRQQVRTAESVDPCAPSNKLAFFRPGDPNEYTYAYTAGTRTLSFSRTRGGATVSQTLFDSASPVTLDGFAVSQTTGMDGNSLVTRRIRMSLLFAMGKLSLPVTCSAAVRRNQDY